MSWREAIAKAILGGKVGGPHPGGIHTYHSSPHDFDKFDWSKLKSGEGANVYGAGFYSAEHPKVSGLGGEYWNSFTRRFPTEEIDATNLLSLSKFDRELAAKEARDMLNRNREWEALTRSTAEREDAARRNAHFEKTVRLLEGDQPIGPRTYELNLKVKPEELLDWDKTLAQQQHLLPQLYEAGLAPRSLNTETLAKYGDWGKAQTDYINSLAVSPGRDVYRKSAAHYDNPAAASEALRDAGVPGIRYADQQSRMVDTVVGERQRVADHWRKTHAESPTDENRFWLEGAEEKLAEAMRAPKTYNYVMFDPGKIDIMAKYALPGMATGGFGALAAQDAYEVTDGVR